MKTTFNFMMAKRAFAIILLTGLAIAFNPATLLAQAPGKAGKGQKPVLHSTLPEAEVTASLNANLLQVAPLRVNFSLLNPTGKLVNVSIRKYSGEKVFQEASRGTEYNRVFLFDSTPSDTYSFKINSYKYSESRPFKIVLTKHRTLIPGALVNQNASADNSPPLMAAIYEVEPFKIKIHLVNDSGKMVEYFIRNNKDEVVFRGQTGEAKFSKTFDMDQLGAGKYTFEIKNRAGKISRTFDIHYSEERSFVWLDKRGQPLKPASTAYQSGQITR